MRTNKSTKFNTKTHPKIGKEKDNKHKLLLNIMHMLCSWYPKINHPNLYYNPTSEFTPNLSIKNSQQPECPKSLFPPTNQVIYRYLYNFILNKVFIFENVKRFISMQSVAAIVFGDGSSSHSRLYPLTKRRSEAAIPIAGNYRLIDSVVSNCINSGITKIYAITQFNSTSLNSHISRAYSGARLSNDGFVEVIAAYQSPEDNGWFQGTADAIRRCLWMLEEYPVEEFLVLPGHHLYKMEYHKLIDAHRRTKSDITVSVLTSRKNDIIEDVGFGIFKLNDENQVVEFRENSETMVSKFDQDKAMCDFASMGIYVINRDVMIKLLTEYFPRADELKSQVIPGAISLGMKIHGYGFDGHWEDMRSIAAYYRANMETLRRTNKPCSFYDRDYPLYTLPRHLPPTLVTDAVITDSFIGDGCILSRCRIKGTVLGMRTRIRDDAVIEDSVIMGSDSYHHQNGEGEATDIPVGIGECSYIKKAIIDKNARIGKNVMITNKDNVVEGNMEANGYIVSGGIIVIIRGAVIPDGTII